MQEVNTYTFMIVDPFDRTYNPARNIKRDTDIETNFYEEMEYALNCLIEEGRIPRSPPEPEKKKKKRNKKGCKKAPPQETTLK